MPTKKTNSFLDKTFAKFFVLVLFSIVAFGGVTLYGNSRAASSSARIKSIRCTAVPSEIRVGPAAAGGIPGPYTCTGYERGVNQPNPVPVSNYMHTIVERTSGNADFTNATLYIAPAGPTLPPNWTPVATNVFETGSGFTVLNADTTKFPIVTKKCANNVGSSRRYQTRVELVDTQGSTYKTNILVVQIPFNEYTNPPVCAF